MNYNISCENCVKHPTMKGYYKCIHTGQLLSYPCMAWEGCKHCKPRLSYRIHQFMMKMRKKVKI